MNKHQIKGNWKILKGKAKERWGELTDDELDQIDGETPRPLNSSDVLDGQRRRC